MNIVQAILQLFKAIFGRKVKPVEQPPKVVPKPQPATPVPTPQPADVAPPAEPPHPHVAPLEPLPTLTINQVKRNGRDFLIVTDGKVEAAFRPHKQGLFTGGGHRMVDFLTERADDLQQMNISQSAVNIIRPVSENEGNLDAINTWDNSFLSFGMFQWTLGAGEDAGELPALLLRIKEWDQDVFETYFGRYGLDVSEETDPVYGYLTHEGTAVKARSRKEGFRSPEWAFRFWQAGHDAVVKAMQLRHAVDRLNTFYWKPKYRIEGHLIAEIITSEYGVSLILDNHVNRPGYVDKCLSLAFKEANLNTGPKEWTTADELKVIDAYLGIRQTYGQYPMTHAAERAAKVRAYVDKGLLSTERGSFVFDEADRSRSLDPNANIGIPPTGYNPNDYPEITHFDEEAEVYLEREEGME